MRILLLFLGLLILAIHARRVIEKRDSLPSYFPDEASRSSYPEDPMTEEQLETLKKLIELPNNHERTRTKYGRKSIIGLECLPGMTKNVFGGCVKYENRKKWEGTKERINFPWIGFEENDDVLPPWKYRNAKYLRKSLAPFKCPPGMPTNYIPGCIQSDHWEKMEESRRGNSDDEDRKDYWPYRPWEYEGFPY